MKTNEKPHRAILQDIANRPVDRGLLPDFSAAALAELERLQVPAATPGEALPDLGNLLWASIDNDDSRDLDQLTVAEAMPGDRIRSWWRSRTWIAWSRTARPLTTTPIITPPQCIRRPRYSPCCRKTFHGPHFAELQRRSTGPGRRSGGGPDGTLQDSTIYRARVRKRAKLAYSSVGAWLEGKRLCRNPLRP